MLHSNHYQKQQKPPNWPTSIKHPIMVPIVLHSHLFISGSFYFHLLWTLLQLPRASTFPVTENFHPIVLITLGTHPSCNRRLATYRVIHLFPLIDFPPFAEICLRVMNKVNPPLLIFQMVVRWVLMDDDVNNDRVLK